MINYINRLFNRHHTLRYLIIGAFNTVMSLLVYYGLLKLQVHYLLASGITNVFGILEGYLLNSVLVFKNKVKFSALLNTPLYMALDLSITWFNVSIVRILSIGEFIAQVLTIVITTVLNYWLVKRFVFAQNN